MRILNSRRTALALVERRRRRGDQLVVERPREPMVLRLAAIARDFGRHLRLVEHAREIEAARLPVLDAALACRAGPTRPISSLNERMPSFAISSRTSSATKKK